MKFKSVRIFIDHDVDIWSGDKPTAENLEFVFDDSNLNALVHYVENPRTRYSKCPDGGYVISPRNYVEFVYCLQNTLINSEKGDLDVYKLEETYDVAGLVDGLEITEVAEDAGVRLIDYATEALLDENIGEDDIEAEREYFKKVCLSIFNKKLEESRQEQA